MKKINDILFFLAPWVVALILCSVAGTKAMAVTNTATAGATWAAATWAIEFYRRNGFALVTPGEKYRLLKTYWTIPDRQIETSVVLADARSIAAAEAES